MSAGNDTTICLGEDFYLQVPQIFNSYLWNNSTINSNSIRVDTTGLWILTATYGNGCIAIDSININIINCKFSIANIITPNEDGKNDFFIHSILFQVVSLL